MLERQRSITRWIAAWLAGCALLVSGAGARAQAIAVHGEDGCVTERGLRVAMEQYEGRFDPEPAVRARVRVAANELSFELLRDDTVLAERQFASVPRRCKERVRALAIALALAFENVRQSERSSAAGETASAEPSGARGGAKQDAKQEATTAVPEPPEASPAPEEPKRPVPEPTPAERSAGRPEPGDSTDEQVALPAAPEPHASSAQAPALVLHAGGGVVLGVLPEPLLAFSLGVAVSLSSSFQLELWALASPGVRYPLADGTVDAQLIGGQAALCLGTPLGRLRARGCAGIAAAAVPAQGRDFAIRDESTVTGWTAGLIAATLELAVMGPLSARAFAGVYGSLVRPALEAKVDGSRRDATPLPIGGAFLLEVLWALP